MTPGNSWVKDKDWHSKPAYRDSADEGLTFPAAGCDRRVLTKISRNGDRAVTEATAVLASLG
jgi:hypothetical protein